MTLAELGSWNLCVGHQRERRQPFDRRWPKPEVACDGHRYDLVQTTLSLSRNDSDKMREDLPRGRIAPRALGAPAFMF
jgi:hypothetical protein